MNDNDFQTAFREAGKEYAAQLENDKRERENPRETLAERQQMFADLVEAQLESRRTHL